MTKTDIAKPKRSEAAADKRPGSPVELIEDELEQVRGAYSDYNFTQTFNKASPM